MEEIPENVKQYKKFLFKAKKMQKVGLLKEALQYLDKAINLDSYNQSAYALKGTLLSETKQFKESLEFFDKSLSLSKSDFSVYLNKGIALKELKNYEDAIQNFNMALEISPNDNLCLINKCLIYRELKKYKEALECIEEALNFNPNNYDLHQNKGIIYKEMKLYSEAIEELNKAIELKPDESGIYNNKGIILKEQGKLTEALEMYNKALQINPNDSIAFYNKALLLAKQKQYKEAVENYSNALYIDKYNVSALNNKGLALDELKRYTEAIICYDRAINIDQNHAPAYNNKGVTLMNLQKYYEAIEYYDKAISIDPKYIAAYNNKGYTLYELKKYSQAVEYIDKALDLDNHNYLYFLNKSKVLYEISHYEEALKCYDKAYELNPSLDLEFREKLNQCGIELRTKKIEELKNNGITEYDDDLLNKFFLTSDIKISGDSDDYIKFTMSSMQYIARRFSIGEDFNTQLYSSFITTFNKIYYDKFDNEYLMKYKGVYMEKNFFYLISEYYPNNDLLKNILNKDFELPLKKKIEILICVLKAMNYLHQNNVFLYELKASNVILINDDNIVIRNFGFGDFISQRSKKLKSASAPWTAPEILRGENYQKVSDIYSFGIFMWELCSRSKVYQELSKGKEIKNYVLNYGRPNLQLIENDTPEWFIGLMKDCWSNKKEDRPAPFKIMDLLKNELIKFGE